MSHNYCFKWTVSSCFLKSIFLWNVSLQPILVHANGLTPWCFLMWVIKLDDCENDFPQIRQLCGFSPEILRLEFSIVYIRWRYRLNIISDD